MVGAHCTTFSFLTPATTNVRAPMATKQRKAIILSSIATSFPMKLRKRKNSLRPKLLETLTKLNPTSPLLSQESPFPIEPHEILQEISYEQTSGEPFTIVVGDDDKTTHQNETESHQFLLSPTSGPGKIENGEVGIFSTGSLLKLGLYLVGIFVFQTICAVWVLGSANSDQEQEISDSEVKNSQLSTNERSKGKFLLNADGKNFGEKIGHKPNHAVYLNESELEEKIAEIRTMAKEARDSEGKKLKNNGLNSYIEEAGGGDADEDAISSVRSGIQEEVDARLLKLQKKLNATAEKAPLSSVSHLNKFGNVEENRMNGGHSNVAELNKTLMFKKKMKFRNSPSMPRDDPKGFQPLGNSDVSKKKKNSSSTVERMVDLPASNSQQNYSSSLEEDCIKNALRREANSVENHGKKLEKGREGKKMGGTVNADIRNVKRQSSEQVTKNSQHCTKLSQITASKPNAMLGRNGSSNGRKVGSKDVDKGFRDKSTDIKGELWWLRLPYVMALLMRRGSNHEVQRGLYSLKIPPSHESDPIAYAVTFEDRGDATNFCYLLESFFEDLGDFSADIVPLSIKELHEAVKSDSMKVIVVKKGQLQLYAGQPLSDVEMALRSLVE